MAAEFTSGRVDHLIFRSYLDLKDYADEIRHNNSPSRVVYD